jgi:uncharacterized protein (TIGR01244 family)
MIRRLFLVFSLLAGPIACAGDTATDTLKVDLDAVVDQGRVSPVGGITSAGQPDEDAFRVFAENGYVAVIDMRTPEENRGLDEPATIAGLGMEYIAFPIDSGDVTLDKAKELDELLSRYDEPVLVHCASGNRVGALLALREFLASGDRDKALDTGRKGGMTRLEGDVRKVLEEAAGQ